MRNLILLIIGVALGALAAATILNALARRDAYARGTMEVMQHHYAALRDDLRTGKCADPLLRQRKALLASLAEEIEPSVYGDTAPDAPFREYTQRLRDAVSTLPDVAVSCAVLAPAVTTIGNVCDECHRQYR